MYYRFLGSKILYNHLFISGFWSKARSAVFFLWTETPLNGHGTSLSILSVSWKALCWPPVVHTLNRDTNHMQHGYVAPCVVQIPQSQESQHSCRSPPACTHTREQMELWELDPLFLQSLSTGSPASCTAVWKRCCRFIEGLSLFPFPIKHLPHFGWYLCLLSASFKSLLTHPAYRNSSVLRLSPSWRQPGSKAIWN